MPIPAAANRSMPFSSYHPHRFCSISVFFPFLGVLKVPAALRERGWPVDILDLSGVSNWLVLAIECVRHSPAAVFGITATTPQFPGAVKIAEAVRAVRIDARLVLGGTHATLVVAARKAETAKGKQGRAHRAWNQMEPILTRSSLVMARLLFLKLYAPWAPAYRW